MRYTSGLPLRSQPTLAGRAVSIRARDGREWAAGHFAVGRSQPSPVASLRWRLRCLRVEKPMTVTQSERIPELRTFLATSSQWFQSASLAQRWDGRSPANGAVDDHGSRVFIVAGLVVDVLEVAPKSGMASSGPRCGEPAKPTLASQTSLLTTYGTPL
jgi:hypothetical protein